MLHPFRSAYRIEQILDEVQTVIINQRAKVAAGGGRWLRTHEEPQLPWAPRKACALGVL